MTTVSWGKPRVEKLNDLHFPVEWLGPKLGRDSLFMQGCAEDDAHVEDDTLPDSWPECRLVTCVCYGGGEN